MDKRVIFAVAGSGKTTSILEALSEDKRSLIITYTENNLKNIRYKIIEKFGYFPENIKLLSYFTFLYSFCFKPFLSRIIFAKGMSWGFPPGFTTRLKRTNIKYYIDTNNRIYHNRLAKLLEVAGVHEDIVERLEKYFDDLFIDEIQDFAGHDFNLLKIISTANINIQYVGDFFQHTFDTSRDGAINKNLHNDYEKYINHFQAMGLEVDTESLVKSYRCAPAVCDFISGNLKINIESHRSDATEINMINDEHQINQILNDPKIVKLFYNKHYNFGCYSRNWGGCKGEDNYSDICIVLNPETLAKFNNGNLSELAPKTKNKLYVACTRARGNIYFIPQNLIQT